MPFDIINSGRRLFNQVAGSEYAPRLVGEGIRAEHTVKARKEPQHAYRWEFLMRGIFGIDEDLQFYAQRTAIPTMTQEVIRRRYAGTEYTYSGRENSPKVLRCTFYDNQDLEIYRFFHKWMNTMNDPFGNRKVNPINYKKQTEIRLKDTTDGLITESFNFENCYPTEIGEAELDYSSSEVLTFDVMFTYSSMTLGYGPIDMAGDINDTISTANRIITSAPGQELISRASGFVRGFI